MKSCPNCQFLLSPDATICTFCKRPLDSTELSDELVAAGAAFTAAAASGAPTAAAKRPPKRAADAGSAVNWDRSARGYTPPSAASSAAFPVPGSPHGGTRNGTVAKLAIAIIACIILLVVVCVFAIGALGKRALDSAEGAPWVAYTAPDGSFSATVPATPTTATVPLPQGDGTSLIEVDYSFATGPRSGIMVNVVPVRADVLATVPLPSLLDLSYSELAARGISAQRTTSGPTVDAITFEGTWKQSTGTSHVTGGLLAHGSRVFLVIEVQPVNADSAGDAYRRFIKNFSAAG